MTGRCKKSLPLRFYACRRITKKSRSSSSNAMFSDRRQESCLLTVALLLILLARSPSNLLNNQGRERGAALPSFPSSKRLYMLHTDP